MKGPHGVAVIGCGLIGRRRAEVAAKCDRSRLLAVADVDLSRAKAVSLEHGCAYSTTWNSLLEDPQIGVVIVATPNGLLGEIGIAALQSGKDVLIEKPMGRDVAEAQKIADAALATGRRLKIGFNHRYHPSVARAYELYRSGKIGTMINVRARYGHGGRPGFENEWRGDLRLAGGGELTDQGVHLLDLFHWFLGMPIEVFAYVQTAVWQISPLEDNGFALLRFPDGTIASIHTSWTQWKNLFCLEFAGTKGSLVLEGLGGSYGPERLTVVERRTEGGVPVMVEEQFSGEDASWQIEWDDFIGGLEGKAYYGTPEDGLAAMAMLEALYRSAEQRTPVDPNKFVNIRT